MGINVNALTPGYTITEAALSLADPGTIARLKTQAQETQIVRRRVIAQVLTVDERMQKISRAAGTAEV